MKRLTATLALWAGITACAQAAEPITLGLNYPRTGPVQGGRLGPDARRPAGHR